ncbi:hypothetical protein LTR56_022871 [Elasticomyces elasticus]|nr:hypothetical protein LTR56_022871 [Elasticomyces elasticus]KAK3657031.1 hypothetical protein LTR22_009532 [Elasticomyces elasticus]KAK4916254.1 hypothetical protein LTR49_015759 [Elasticomyces elasticus]KAK5764209.1 hypothetical protein LTS12_005660 [Elasticomyces elasticus]
MKQTTSTPAMDSALLLVLISLILPPAGVYLLTGCGADVLINIILTCLGYFPGHVHAFYLIYVYYKERERDEQTPRLVDTRQMQADGQEWREGEMKEGYGTMSYAPGGEGVAVNTTKD